ncbi:uncharacterized protein LOC129579296 [Sitodiplosis mosellana]|uniref:uncharacterized protein LOC129579296 n=1 Tax=Sitodiplosis mosellana TaxID=263140 RepID=UPI00244533F3|nr:uncharacterized protein LOC129579296 [Sitodiplosis mosellana]
MGLKLCGAIIVAIMLTFNCNIYAIPLSELINADQVPTSSAESSESGSGENATVNGTKKDLYVIKAVVYEIGILTEADENATSSEENYSHERVDLTFFDAKSNGSHFDLGQIPLPVQTNVTGQVLTGIAPIDLGTIQNATDILSTLPLTGTIVNITHSDTSFINLSHRPSITENGTILNPADIAKIPGLNGTNPILIDANSPVEPDDE